MSDICTAYHRVVAAIAVAVNVEPEAEAVVAAAVVVVAVAVIVGEAINQCLSEDPAVVVAVVEFDVVAAKKNEEKLAKTESFNRKTNASSLLEQK